MKRLNIEAEYTDIHLNPSIVDDMTTTLMNSLPVGVILVFAGLLISSRANLGAPLIARLFSKKHWER